MGDSDIKLEAAGLSQLARSAGLTQEDIANAVDASQSQVSRILSGKMVRRSKLFDEICIYVNNAVKGVSPETVQGNEELMDAIASVWDGTAHQANALAHVIRSLGGLSRLGLHGATAPKGRKSEHADS